MSEAIMNMQSSSVEMEFAKRAKQVLSTEPILSARDVEVEFTLRGQKLKAIRRCSLDLYDGETLAIVGESGSGKSVFTKTFVGMLDKNGRVTGGNIMYNGVDLAKYTTEAQWRTIRGKKIAMVTQDPMTSLNPLKKVGIQIKEAIELNQNLRGKAAKAEAIKLLELVGIADPERRYGQYPHEFSGGMRQRVVIAIAVACNPQILICDEPTTALDVTIQAQILELIQNLKKQRNLSVIFITHDLGVVANMADRIAVMYAGKIVEYGTSEEVFYGPAHPYTWALLSSMPDLDSKDKLEAIPGTPPDMRYPPKGDAFADRNRYAMKIDFEEQPPEFPISETHWAATWLLHPDAPKVEPPKAVTDRIAKMKARMEAEGHV